MILFGTERGLYEIDDDGGGEPRLVHEDPVVALHGRLAVVEGNRLRRGADGDVRLPEPEATCLVVVDGVVYVGTHQAHLLRVAEGAVEPVQGFEEADGRSSWYTPWGGPPDTRSLSATAEGVLYANVHVGGILRSDDAGTTWHPTIDIDADVHQVLALDDGGTVLAATAYGLARSDDSGATWKFSTEGLHGAYSRAVAVAGDWLLLSASTGPGTRRAAVYRRPLDAPVDAPFERCAEGLPEWFSENVNTGSLAADAAGHTTVIGTPQGSVYRSDDAGASWREVVRGLPPVTSVALVSA
jgi:hypothetical protein